MIRGAALLIFAILSWALPAHSDATYYFVDNSGSMTQYREGEDGVDREVEALVRQSPVGSELYVHYFRGETKTDCESSILLPSEPVQVSEDFTLDPGSAGGSTLIVNAVSALHEIDAESEAHVVLYTDGSFEDSVCETPQLICRALLELQRERPLVRFKFEAPRALRNRGEPVLSCAGLLPFDRPLTVQRDGNENGERGNEPRIVWLSLIAMLLFPILLVVPFLINIMSIRRFTVDIETADKVFDPNKTLVPREIWAYWISGFVIVVTILVVVACYIFNPDARDTHIHWFNAANKPLLSIIYAYAYTVVVGWYVIERMRDSHARKQNEWKVNFAESVRQFEVSEVSRIQSQFARARREQDDIERSLISDTLSQLEDEAGDEWESNQQRILELSNRVQTIKARIDRALGEVTTYKELKENQNASFADYEGIAKLLRDSERIDGELERGIKRFFAAWSNLLGRLPRIDGRQERIINEFDVSAFDADDDPQQEP